ncbi:MAG: helix-turn-helix domain-containing protein [Symbiobacteriia bacterium]
MPNSKFAGDPASLPYVLTIRQAAEVIGSSQASVYEMVRQNKIPHFRFGSRGIRIQRNALLEWMGATPPSDADGAGQESINLRDAVLAATLLKLNEVEASLEAIRAMLKEAEKPNPEWASVLDLKLRYRRK